MNLYGKRLSDIVLNRKVLFITTREIEYIRNAQEIRILKEKASSVDIICSNKKNYVLRIVSVWNKIRKNRIRQADIVFVGFSPQLVIPFLGRRLTEKTIIIDFFISVYDTLIYDRKKFKDGSLVAKICHWLDEKTLQKASHVIVDTKAHMDYFVSEFSERTDRFETIYLEADPTIYYPRIQTKPEELKDKFIVLYFGSILPLQGVNVVLDAIRELKDREDIQFQIIGPISERYNKPIQNNVEYIKWLPQKQLAQYIANADLCLAGHFNNEIEKARRTIPGKAYIYEAMKKKMILGDNVANHEFFTESEDIHFVPMGNAERLKDAISSFAEHNI